MKTVFLAATLIGFLISTETFCQKITYKKLVGTWYKKDTVNEKLSFKFTDPSNLNIQSSLNGSSTFTYKLITDSIKGQSILQINSNSDGILYSSFYTLQLIKKNTLTVTNLNYNDPIALRPEDINKRTFYLVKKD